MTTTTRTLLLIPPLSLLLACGSDSGPLPSGLSAFFFGNSEWSPPVNVGAPINTAATENNCALSPDDLSLYFTSNRAGGFGSTDIWVAHRACVDCPWETPVNLGPTVNTASGDQGPSISLDGHLLFFYSDRPGGEGSNDIYVSRRANPKDDFAWEAPVNLGPNINTAIFEAGPEYLQSAEDGELNFYFGRAPVTGVGFSMYVAPLTRDGKARGPAVLVPELSPGTGATVRTDGREVVFLSARPGGLGLQDLWVSTRRSVHDPWSTPENLTALNSTAMDRHPSFSSDARTLIFASNRPGGFGGDDIWMSTRSPSGH